MLTPHDEATEAALLGAVIMHPELLDEVRLAPTDFHKPANTRIYEALLQLTNQGTPIDLVTLAAKLDTRDANHALDAATANYTTAHATNYAETISELSLRRRLIAAGIHIQAHAEDGLEAAIDALLACDVDRSGGSLLSDVVTALDLTTPAETLWTELLPTLRIHRGDLIVIGARPAVGKSAFAAQLAMEWAKRRLRTLIVTYEMSAEDYARRYIQAGVGYDRVRQEQGLTEAEALYARSSLSGWSQFVTLDDSCPELSQLAAKVRAFARSGGWAVIVDHLQIAVEQDYDSVSKATRALKLAANDHRLGGKRPAIIALSQLNRGVARDDGSVRPPALTDLRASGTVEQDADAVALLHYFDLDREAEIKRLRQNPRHKWLVDEKDRTWRVTRIELAKNRHGLPGRWPAWFSGAEQHWTLMDELG